MNQSPQLKSVTSYQADFFRFEDLERPFRPHFHECLMAGFLASGERQFTCEQISLLVRPFQLVLVPPYAIHACSGTSAGKSDWICLHIPLPDGYRFSGSTIFQDSGLPRLVMRKLLGASHDSAQAEILIASATRDILSLAAEWQPAAAQRLEREQLLPEGGKFRLEEAAAERGMNKYSYLRSFRKQTGITPGRCAMSGRLNQARKMLRQGKDPAACAQACGFCDQSHFNRRFKDSLGVTPGQYRRAWAL